MAKPSRRIDRQPNQTSLALRSLQLDQEIFCIGPLGSCCFAIEETQTIFAFEIAESVACLQILRDGHVLLPKFGGIEFIQEPFVRYAAAENSIDPSMQELLWCHNHTFNSRYLHQTQHIFLFLQISWLLVRWMICFCQPHLQSSILILLILSQDAELWQLKLFDPVWWVLHLHTFVAFVLIHLLYVLLLMSLSRLLQVDQRRFQMSYHIILQILSAFCELIRIILTCICLRILSELPISIFISCNRHSESSLDGVDFIENLANLGLELIIIAKIHWIRRQITQ